MRSRRRAYTRRTQSQRIHIRWLVCKCIADRRQGYCHKKGRNADKIILGEVDNSAEQAKSFMASEMVTVIPKGKKCILENFAGTNEIQTINAFAIAKHEMTQEVYAAVMGVNPSYYDSNPARDEVQEKRPVECVSWYDAIVFCNKLSELMGLTPCYKVEGETDVAEWNYTLHNGDSISGEIECDLSADGYRLPIRQA